MTNLKLPKLPDQTPVKIAFRASPELAQMLTDYAAIYRAAYGQPDATVEELIPFMLATFIASDKRFKKARKQLGSAEVPTRPATVARRPKRQNGTHPTTTSDQ